MTRPIGSTHGSGVGAATTFIRDWRVFLGLSQEAVVARLQTEHGIVLSPSHLSNVERGKQPYNQRILEGLAQVMGLTPADLLSARPGAASPKPLVDLWVTLEPNEQSRLVQMARLAFGKPAP